MHGNRFIFEKSQLNAGSSENVYAANGGGKIVILIRALPPPPPETPFPMLLLVIFKFDGADSVTLFCGFSKRLRSRWFILQSEIRLAVNVAKRPDSRRKMLGKKSNSIILSKAFTTTQWGKKEEESVLGKLDTVTLVC